MLCTYAASQRSNFVLRNFVYDNFTTGTKWKYAVHNLTARHLTAFKYTWLTSTSLITDVDSMTLDLVIYMKKADSMHAVTIRQWRHLARFNSVSNVNWIRFVVVNVIEPVNRGAALWCRRGTRQRHAATDCSENANRKCIDAYSRQEKQQERRKPNLHCNKQTMKRWNLWILPYMKGFEQI